MLDHVDEDDKVIGRVSWEEAHKKSLRHRSVHVLLFNGNGEVLSQLRSEKHEIKPLYWSSSVSGHVDAGENPAVAAARECSEELGISPRLYLVGKFSHKDEDDNEFVYVYRGVFSGKPKRLTWETKDVGWFTVDYVLENPDGLKLDTNFLKALKLYVEKA